MIGSTPPGGHQGSVEGEPNGGGGPIHPGFADTLAGFYAFGLSDNATTDNTLIGSYFQLFLNSEGGIAITQVPASTGADFDSHPDIQTQRNFTIAGILGLHQLAIAQYPSGSSGGMFDRYRFVGGSVFDFMDYRRYVSSPSTLDWYDPVVNGATGNLGTVEWKMLDAVGGGHQNSFLRQSDGVIFNQCLFPTAAPHKMGAFVTTMNRRDTGAAAPPNGSALGWRVAGPDSGYGIGVSAEIASMYAVLDSQNFGSAQATGHWDFYASGPALATGPTLAFSMYPERASTTALELNGTTSPVSTAGTARLRYNNTSKNVEVSVDGGAYQRYDSLQDGQWFQTVIESNVVDLAVATTFSFPTSSLPGFYFTTLGAQRWVGKVQSGTASTGPTMKAGNNGASRDNVLTISANAPPIASHAAGAPSIGGGVLTASNVKLLDLTAPIVGEVTVAATGTGGFAWTGRYYITGLLFKASSL